MQDGTPGPVAVVTGGSSGIGRATTLALLTKGYTVHVLDMTEHGEGAVASHIVDVSDPAALERAATTIGPIDALITAAGVNLTPDDGRMERLSIEAWRQTLRVNLDGTAFTYRSFRPLLRPGGRVVTIGSVAAMSALVGQDAYTASKGAIVALTRAWAVDATRDQIAVNCVCPGPTSTPLLENVLDRFPRGARIELPQQRPASAEEVATVITFLASEAPSYMTGAILPVDGGSTANTAGMPFPRSRQSNSA